ncbi:hypothetical protein HDU97_009286 [Phlyctochytrium planicorne]|nr:hypothetical protein HDU97_009286 [Phlyctochytrium planicorne]
MFVRMNTVIVAAGLFALAVAAPADQFEYPWGSADISVVSTASNSTGLRGSTRGPLMADLTILVNTAVKNKGSQRVVGVIYTNNSWSDTFEAYADLNTTLANGYDLWTVKIPRGTHFTTDINPEYELAAFVSYDNQARIFDPQNNFFVYYKATPAAPLALINDGLEYDKSTKKVNLVGSVRTYSANRASDYQSGNVIVRWTVDDWATAQESLAIPPANFSSNAWTWSIPVAGVDNFPANVKYSLSYKAVSPVFSIDNSGSKYVKVINPRYWASELPEKVSGVIDFLYNVTSNLPIVPASVYLDEKALPFNNKTTFSTKFLSNGKHKLDILVSLVDGPVIHTETISFSVDNKFQPISSWTNATLPGPVNEYLRSPAAAVRNDKIYLGLSTGLIVRFDSASDPNYSAVFNISNSLEIPVISIAVDNDGVYVLGNNTLYKLNEKTGKPAEGFQVSYVDFATLYDGTSGCPSAIAVSGDGLFVADNCEGRVLKFSSSTGKFISSANIDGGVHPMALTVDGKDVVVASNNYADQSIVVCHIAADTNGVVSGSTIKYPQGGRVQAIATMDGRYAVIRNDNVLSYLSMKDGTIEASWFGGGGDKQFLGNIKKGNAILPLTDGTFFVSDESIPNLQRFSQKLL